MGSLDNNIRLIRNETVEGGNTKERIAETFELLATELERKVNKDANKGLSSNDFSNEHKDKLEGLQQVDTSGLLQKGAYTGNASSLKADIDKKVDKVAGKGLSSNDYTNEEKRKNEENALKRFANITVTGDVNKIITITFADSTVMQAPFKDNDHRPLADVHMNSLNFNENTGVLTGVKNDGNEISVSLDGRYSLIGHNHDERYAPITHHHNEYALRTHRHNWDDIDGKPNNLATTDNIKTAIEGIQIGGRNLILKSRFVKNELGNWSDYQDDIFGNVVRIDRPVNNGNFQHLFTLVPYNYNNKDLIFMVIAKPLDNGSFNFGRWINSFEAISVRNGTAIKNTQKKDLGDGWSIYWSKVNMSYLGDGSFGLNSVEGSWLFYTCGLFEGNTLVSWSPAPEDIMPTQRAGASISTNWTAVVEHQNNTIFVENSLSIELNQLQNMGSISFIKTFDTGAVTFTCAGKNIIYPFDNQFNGKKGSTAVVSIHNNDCYIRISNV